MNYNVKEASIRRSELHFSKAAIQGWSQKAIKKITTAKLQDMSTTWIDIVT